MDLQNFALGFIFVLIVVDRLVQIYERINSNADSDPDEQEERTGVAGVVCNHCGRLGHRQSNCIQRLRNELITLQRAEQERLEHQRAQQERADREREEAQRAEQERADQERGEAQRADQERADQERARRGMGRRGRGRRGRGYRERAGRARADPARADPLVHNELVNWNPVGPCVPRFRNEDDDDDEMESVRLPEERQENQERVDQDRDGQQMGDQERREQQWTGRVRAGRARGGLTRAGRARMNPARPGPVVYTTADLWAPVEQPIRHYPEDDDDEVESVHIPDTPPPAYDDCQPAQRYSDGPSWDYGYYDVGCNSGD